MPSPFFSNTVSYHQNPVVSEINFRKSYQEILTASKAIDAQHAMESRLESQSLKFVTHIQRQSALDVVRALVSVHKVYGQDIIIQSELEDMVLNHDDGVVRPDFEKIYLAGEELLSSDFNHVTTDELNQLKYALLIILLNFENDVLNNRKHEFNNYLSTKDKLEHCRHVIMQTRQLIESAKTVSGIIASIVKSIDVLAQMGLADHKSVATVFKNELPETLGLEVEKMDLKTALNRSGSAFQLEQARESLIKKLEMYLNKRASLDSKIESPAVSKRYKTIDRGIFYNRELQQARVVIAANLLTQLQYGHREDGDSISNPFIFAKLLMDAIDANEQCYEQYAGCMDGAGELAECLDCMRREMSDIYTQTVQWETGQEPIDLHTLLRLEQTNSPRFTT